MTVYSGSFRRPAVQPRGIPFTMVIIGVAVALLFTLIYIVNVTASMHVRLMSQRNELNQQQRQLSLREQSLGVSLGLSPLHQSAASGGLVVAKEQESMYMNLGVALNEVRTTSQN